ncbi:MAG: cobalt-precorrin 5A hydrolase [Tissierellaceae bacterium]
MKLICFSFSERGSRLGESLTDLRDHEIVHYRNRSIEGGVKSILKEAWGNYQGIIFISATGIATRLIAPYIEHKTKDPAVVVIDDLGRFVISLLSGHLGGANDIAEYIASKIDALPIITTASDSRGFQAIDIFAKDKGYHMENLKSITELTAMMVDDKKIGFYTEDTKIIDYPRLKVLDDLKDIEDIDGIIMVSSERLRVDIPHTNLIPKNINIGIGCRKGIEGKRIIAAIEDVLSSLNISNKGIKTIGTVEVKRGEQGIIDTARYYNCPLKIFSIEEIKEVENRFEKSQFVKDTIGAYSVAEPCAYLLGGKFLSMKTKHNGITISITKEVGNG